MDMNEVYGHLDQLFESGRTYEAEDYLIQCMQKAQELKDYNSLIMLLNEMIGFCRETSQKEKSLGYSAQVIQLMQQLDLTGTVAYATTLLNVANACRAAGKLQEAYQFYMEVFPVYDKLLEPDDFYYASLYNNLSLLFQEMEEYEQALECLEKALRISEQTSGKEFETAVTHTNIASTLCKLAEQVRQEEVSLKVNRDELGYDKGKQLATEALEEADTAIQAFKQMEVRDVHMAAAFTAYADALVLLEKEDRASEYYQKALQMIEKAVGRTEGYIRVQEKLLALNNSGKTILMDSKEMVYNGLTISRSYFEAYGKKMIFSKFPEYINKIAVGLCGEGSDCLGFDDEYSRDHDFGPGFALWISDATYREIGAELEQAYESLPGEYMGMKRIETKQAKGRTGVCTFKQYLERITGLNHVPESDQEWLYIDEASLAAAVSGEVFCDPEGKFTRIRCKLMEYYPERVWRRKLAQELSLFSQDGQYNYQRMAKRSDYATANLLLTRAAEHAMKLVYLLNHKYAPHTKWLLRGMEDCERLELAADLITSLLHEIGNRENETEIKSLQIEKLAFMILNELKVQGLVPENAEDTYLILYAEDIASANRDINNECSNDKAKNGNDKMTRDKENSKEVNKEGSKEDYKEDYKEDLVNAVVHMEWKAFDEVKNEGGRASCQNNWPTFNIMRRSQYLTWTEEMLKQYIYDFQKNREKGWNPITEKYARMMESTAKEKYDELKDSLPVISPEKKEIMEAIIKIQVQWMEEFSLRYPKVAGNARVIHTSEDNPFETSYETYLRGEIGTYSDEMLMLYGRFIAVIAQNGENLAQMTMENTVHLYGYDTLEQAEQKMI